MTAHPRLGWLLLVLGSGFVESAHVLLSNAALAVCFVSMLWITGTGPVQDNARIRAWTLRRTPRRHEEHEWA